MPGLVTQDHDRRRIRASIFRNNCTPEERLHTQKFEGVGRDLTAAELLGAFAVGVKDIHVGDTDQVLEDMVLLVQGKILGHRKNAAPKSLAACRIIDKELRQPVGGFVRKWLYEDIVDYAKDNRGCANSKR